jgi:hypothetical protein
MPIEIRELVIRTTIDNSAGHSGQLNPQELEALKKKLTKQILGECKTMIDQKLKHQRER